MKKRKKFAILAAALSFGVGSQTFASETDYVYYNGEKFVEFEFFNAGEFTAQYTLSDTLKNATKSAVSYWSEILGPRSKFSQPWQILITNQANLQNAEATTDSFLDKNEVNDNYVAQMLQGKKTLDPLNLKNFGTTALDEKDDDAVSAFFGEVITEGKVGFSFVKIGQHAGANRTGAVDGWWVDTDTILPTNEQAAGFAGTIRHELGHALGIGVKTQNCDWDGNTIEDDDKVVTYGEKKYTLSKFADDIADEDNWIMKLVDQNGNHAKAGMLIISTEGFEKIKAENPAAVESDYFIVDADNLAYFVGENVTDALAGAKFNNISGLPVNSWEEDTDEVNSFEGSHIETPGMMSHRDYRNYTTFMEVELAAMQDIGYDIDRKAYYGRSIYTNNGTINNTQGYSARNSDGTAYTSDFSQVPLGVGLHIYGTNNSVTQSANILTQGTGAVGVRIDGVENNFTVPTSTEIHADGKNGKGIVFAYGRNHNLNLNGTVTATGEGGNAVEFNFGSNIIGALGDYRGSYIRYQRNVHPNTGEIAVSSNSKLTDMTSDKYNYSADELNGEMVTDFNLAGKITGGENAIYISKNALVKNININRGAQISGNITSDWKHFTEADGFSVADSEKDEYGVILFHAVRLQYNGGEYIFSQYIPDLVTNLNFNANQTYSGDISGADNMKLNVAAGTLNYGGAADVINVNVAQGAKLHGGTFTVNDLSANLADGFSDDTTGKFYNHGTISGVTINGDLVSDGTLTDENGAITVSGAAAVDGSTVASEKISALNETATVLTANSISGKLANSANNPDELAPLLSGYGEIAGNKINYTVATSNNLGALSEDENLGFNAVKNMSNNTEVLPVYNLDATNAKNTLAQIGSSDSVQLLSAAQQSTVANRVISDRLATAFTSNTINFNVGGNNFADGDDTILMGVSANYDTPADNNFWVKFTKNWGELKGGADYHGSAISGGYDRALSENWRGGIFISYNATNLSSNNSGGNAYDTRGGFYFGYNNDVDNSFFYIDAGKIRNKLNRSIGALGLSTEAKYNSNIFELGGEYKRNVTPEKSFAVSPFINLQFSHLKQNDYTETGAGVFNQHVQSNSNNYFAGQLGVEYKKILSHGNYAARIGIKHAFTGADPELNFSYEGDANNFYTLKNNQDKTHFVLSIGGENNFKSGWILGGDIGWQKGAHYKDITASVLLRKIW